MSCSWISDIHIVQNNDAAPIALQIARDTENKHNTNVGKLAIELSKNQCLILHTIIACLRVKETTFLMEEVHLYQTCVASFLLYGCEVWCPNLRQTVWKCIERVLVLLTSFQNIFMPNKYFFTLFLTEFDAPPSTSMRFLQITRAKYVLCCFIVRY